MPKIMVIDDEPDAEYLFTRRFRKEIKKGEMEFVVFLSAREAISYLQTEEAQSIDLILSDINMPEISGLELLKFIKENYGELKVFTISACGDEEHYRMAREHGADDYIQKPVDFKKLKEKIFKL